MVDPLVINADGGVPSYDAAEFRRGLTLPLQYGGRAMGGRQGVRPGGTQLLATIDGSNIDVAPGVCYIDPAWASVQAGYWVAFPTETTVGPIEAADATDPRLDRVWARVWDDELDGGSGLRTADIEYEAGVADPSPVPPTLPQGAIPLWQVDVPAQGQGSPLLVDERQWTVVGPVLLTFTSNDSLDVPTAFPWARVGYATAVGSGAAAGGAEAAASGQGSMGSGGGAGATSTRWFEVVELSWPVTITVPAGGTGSSGATGGNGAQASFGGAATAPGGSGGLVRPSSAVGFGIDGGSGGAAGAGDLAVPGEHGGWCWGIGSLGVSGQGAGTMYGAGGKAVRTNSAGQSLAGNAGTGFGAGGSGAISSSTGGAAAGGGGAPALVTVVLF